MLLMIFSLSFLSKIGIKTGVMGKVGNDMFGEYLISEMRKYGLDSRGIIKDKKVSTSSTMVLVSSDGERSFLHYIGANAELKFSDIDFDIIKDYKILDVSGYFVMDKLDGKPTVEILKRAKKLGLTTILDVCWDAKNRWMKLIEPCLKYVDFFVPSYEEAVKMSGKKEPSLIAKEFLKRGVRITVIKMGSEGSFIATRNKEHRIPPFKVKAVDTLGAGDSFVAGFLTGVVKGWTLEESARFANAVGACCVSAIGASTGIKTLKQTIEFMKRTNVACNRP